MHKRKLKNKTYIFKEDVAKKYGLKEAILIQHFQFSISNHKKNDVHFYSGRYWAYDSLKNLTELYPFISKRTIQRIIKHLKDENILLTGNFNKNKHDQTAWFAFQNEDEFICG